MPPIRAARLLSDVTRGLLGGAQQRQQVAGESEVAEVVAAELQLEAVGRGLAIGRLHDAGVVDQDVDGSSFGVEFFAERFDARQRRQVEALDGQLRSRAPSRGSARWRLRPWRGCGSP